MDHFKLLQMAIMGEGKVNQNQNTIEEEKVTLVPCAIFPMSLTYHVKQKHICAHMHTHLCKHLSTGPWCTARRAAIFIGKMLQEQQF